MLVLTRQTVIMTPPGVWCEMTKNACFGACVIRLRSNHRYVNANFCKVFIYIIYKIHNHNLNKASVRICEWNMWNVLITCYNDCLFKKSLRSHPYVSKQGIFELTDWVIYRNQELEVSISEGGGLAWRWSRRAWRCGDPGEQRCFAKFVIWIEWWVSYRKCFIPRLS